VVIGCDTAKMAANPKPMGAVGGRVASNLRRLRKGISTYELQRRLTEIGWPIRANAITLIEAGRRRVDVDDLVALAVVLGVNPNQLLFPAMLQRKGISYGVPVVGDVTAMDADIWRWATGERPLVRLVPDDAAGEFTREDEPSGQEIAEFVVSANPHHYLTVPGPDDDTVAILADVFRTVMSRGTQAEQLRKLLDSALAEAADGES
jgi:hypothetical protein